MVRLCENCKELATKTGGIDWYPYLQGHFCFSCAMDLMEDENG